MKPGPKPPLLAVAAQTLCDKCFNKWGSSEL